jgi:hypothetical protein
MRLYQFLLPARSNSGAISYEKPRQAWEKLALDTCGGFTAFGPCLGQWKGSHSVMVDDLFAYTVAASYDQHEALVNACFSLFPDQEAFAVADLGTLDIISREEVSRPSDNGEPSKVAHALREALRPLNDVAWRLDAAISAERKDTVGYGQHNAANPDGGANAKQGELSETLAIAEILLKTLSYGQN